MNFSTLGLSEGLLRAVADQGYTVPTPIQLHAIPAVLAGGDLLAGAQTGTGKTAGFVLPMLQRLSTSPSRHASGRGKSPRALILTPTRELAAQVEASIKTYGRHLPLTSTAVFGGVGFGGQAAQLRRGVDIVVATPGRLLDHFGQGNIGFSRIEFFVLDEADRMLDMGFIPDVKRLLAVLPKQRQNLLFSATFSEEIKSFAGKLLDRPQTIEVTPPNSTVDVIAQRVHPVDRDRKSELLAWLVGHHRWQQVLVFTRTKHGADKVVRSLEIDGIRAVALHGNKSQNERTRALASFKTGRVNVLVATDIAARGIDIQELPHVVNYDLPNVPEDYIHRIGRTGRAGSSGEAISLVCVDERAFLRDIERLHQARDPAARGRRLRARSEGAPAARVRAARTQAAAGCQARAAVGPAVDGAGAQAGGVSRTADDEALAAAGGSNSRRARHADCCGYRPTSRRSPENHVDSTPARLNGAATVEAGLKTLQTDASLARYLARKAREIALLDDCLETSLSLAPPRTIDEVIDHKFKLAGALRAERSLASWAITETARPEVADWRCGAYRMSFGYQRADLEVRGPLLYPALDERGYAIETLYTCAGMSAIAALFTALVHASGAIEVHAPRGGYGETRELLQRFGERVRIVPLRRRRTADPSSAPRVVLIDSAAGAIPHAGDPMPRDVALVVFDTTCFWQSSGRIRRVVRWARRHDVPIALVRSHAKLDCLGIEYGRLGSIVLTWRRKATPPLLPALVREARDAVRLLGAAPIPAHFPPFSGTTDYREVSAPRTAALIRNTRRLFRSLRESPLRAGVKIYPHGLYVTIAPGARLRVSDVKRAVTALCESLAAEGLPVRHAGSFGFDFVAVEWFPDPLSRRNVIRIAPGDVAESAIHQVARGIVRWFSRQTAGAVPG